MKKIKLSRSQWEAAGVKAGWMKQAQTEWTNLDMMHTDQEIIQHYLELARSSNGAYVDCSKAPSHLRRQIEQLVAEEQDKMSQQPTGFQTPASGKATVKTAQDASAGSNEKGTVSTHGQISDIISALVSNPHLCTMFLQRVFQDSRCQSVAFDIINSEPAILERLPDASAKSKADLQKVAQTPAPQQQQAPQPAPHQPAAKPGYAGLTYGGIVAKNPSIGKMVDWLRAALAYKFKGAMKPDQEKQLRAQQTNLRVALDKMGIQWKQFPEILEVLST